MEMLFHYYGVTFFAESDDDKRLLEELYEKIKELPAPSVELGHTTVEQAYLEIEVA